SVGGITGTTRLLELSNLCRVWGGIWSPRYSSTVCDTSRFTPRTPRSMKNSTLSLSRTSSSLWLSMSALSRRLSPQQ
ncbi:unnamed protein product, partial [Ixodes persulcatus]